MAGHEILLGLKDRKAKPTDSFSASGEHKGTTTSKALRAGVGARKKRKYTAPTAERAAELKEARAEKRRKVAEAKSRKWLVIGLDFGTTFTGIAYITTQNADSGDAKVIKEWASGGRQSDLLEKCPSRYAYASENPPLKEDAWGYDVVAGMKSYSWFKLLLDEDTDATEYDDPLLRQSSGQGMTDLPPGKTPGDLTADYLKQIYNHTQSWLGTVIGKGMVRETPCHYKLTLPATWSHQARERTRQAAELAGFGTRVSGDFQDILSMIDEPEAGAIYAIKSTTESFPDKNPFEVGQGVIVVDMGGGTVDLVSYRLAKIQPLQLDELCVGIGAKCGATSIDRALHSLMTKRYGHAFSSLPIHRIGPASKFMEDFETVKRDFDGKDPTRTFEIHLKMRDLEEKGRSVVQYDFEEDAITLTSADMKSLFEFTINQTLDLVLEQICLIKKKKARTVKTIILCGGLGNCPYIKIKFDEFCEKWFGDNIQVVKPVHSWSAICRGAAQSGLEVSTILSRRSRYHYGFITHKSFDDDEHDEEDAFEDPLYGKRAMNQMTWFVKKDEKLRPGAKREHNCTYTIPPNVQSHTGNEKLYLCMDDIAPARFGPKVHYGGEISISVSRKVLAAERKRLAGEGIDTMKEPIALNVKLSFIMGSEKGVLEVSASSGKTELGNAKMNYEANSQWNRAG